MDCRMWQTNLTVLQTMKQPYWKSWGEMVLRITLEMSRIYKTKSEAIVHKYCTQCDKVISQRGNRLAILILSNMYTGTE